NGGEERGCEGQALPRRQVFPHSRRRLRENLVSHPGSDISPTKSGLASHSDSSEVVLQIRTHPYLAVEYREGSNLRESPPTAPRFPSRRRQDNTGIPSWRADAPGGAGVVCYRL